MIRYVSTRGGAPAVAFREALIAGLAPDGGLYVPERWPLVDAGTLRGIEDAPFADAAALLLRPFMAPWIDEAALHDLSSRAYASFSHPDVAPLRDLGDGGYLLELFHGPTLAFKDVAMQLLGLLFERALEETSGRATIVGATSGDTGGAAVEAFRGKAGVEVVILHPKGRISEVQRRFMTTAREENIRNIAVEGTFDDCQRIVKALFSDRAFSRRHALSGVNSINWARLAIQSVYYFTAVAALRRRGETEAASFVVPTGNFGDVFAGYAAKRMGLPLARLCVAVNRNDIMHRALTSGTYAPADVVPTMSPSMDIQVASNFERLLFEASGRDAAALARLMADFARDARFVIPPDWLGRIRADFVSESVSEEECGAAMREMLRETETLIDPHTAVGLAAARGAQARGALSGPVVTISTAHPAKFPDAVEKATGVRPALPPAAGDLFAREERLEVAPADVESIKQRIDAGRG